MPLVTVINPSPRKGTLKGKSKMATKKKSRSPAQRRAIAKLVALNRQRAKASRRSARKPAAKKSTTRAVATTSTRRRRYRRSSAAAATTAGRVLRYRRPNPIGNFMTQTLIPSAVGGAGALALDVAVAALPLPPTMKTGPMAPIVKAAGAVGLGMLAGQFLGRKTGEQIAAGALTVTMYNVAKSMLMRVGGGKIPGLSEYVGNDEMAAYVAGDDVDAIGYTSSGVQVGEYINGYETGVYR
jgi:hypothetical protein